MREWRLWLYRLHRGKVVSIRAGSHSRAVLVLVEASIYERTLLVKFRTPKRDKIIGDYPQPSPKRYPVYNPEPEPDFSRGSRGMQWKAGG